MVGVAPSDTIFALSSGRLPSGVAVIRVSGPKAPSILQQFCARLPPPRHARLCGIRSPAGELLDRGLVLLFPKPHSETGEDIAEFHLHGGRAVVASVLNALSEVEGCRQAEPGEFARRAFLNGKIDLTGAEALADLVDAETEAQRRFALDNGSGRQRALYEDWRSRLLHARAMIEAELDFADESDVPGSVSDQVWADMRKLRTEIALHIAGYRSAEIIREGFRVVIVGVPNAGKSSLLNALAKREAAIVSDEPGTTRDIVELAIDLGGLKVLLADTAGIREEPGTIERIGIGRALERAKEADLVIELVDPENMRRATLSSERRLSLLSKVDLLDQESRHELQAGLDGALSARTGEGIDELMTSIRTRAEAATGAADLVPFRERHIQLLQTTAAAIDEALHRETLGLELRAEHLRSGAEALGRIAGSVDVEDLLGAIFSSFCIGK